MARPRSRSIVLLAAVGVAACRAPAHTLVVYSNLRSELLSSVEGAFEDAHPDVDVRMVFLSPADALARLKAERSAPQASVWWGAPSSTLAQAAADSLLAPTHPSWFGAVPANVRDPGGHWIGSLEDPLVIAVSTERMSLSLAPRDWIDLFHPRLQGDIILPEPGKSPSGSLLVGNRLATQMALDGDTAIAWDWLRRLDAQTAGYLADESRVVDEVVRGRAVLTVARLSRAEAALADAGPEKLVIRVPESPTPVLVEGIAIVAGAPDAQAAAEFVQWTGDPGVAQGLAERFYLMPARSDVETEPPAWLSKVLPFLKPQIVSADTLGAHMSQWLEWWSLYVRGRGQKVLASAGGGPTTRTAP